MGSRLTTFSSNYKQVYLEILSFLSYHWKFEHFKCLNVFLCNVHTITLLLNWVSLFAHEASPGSYLLVTQPQRTECGICKYCVAIVVGVLHINKLHSVANSNPRVEISLGLVYCQLIIGSNLGYLEPDQNHSQGYNRKHYVLGALQWWHFCNQG